MSLDMILLGRPKIHKERKDHLVRKETKEIKETRETLDQLDPDD